MKKITKKNLIIIIGCIFIIAISIYSIDIKLNKKWIPHIQNYSNINILEYMKPVTGNYVNVFDTVEELITGDRNIYFLETSHINKNKKIIINPRQGCAIESAALMNPTMKIYFYIFNTQQQSLNYSTNTKNIVMQLMKYKNIVIRHIFLEEYFKNSPMEHWWNSSSGPLTSHWFVSHMSDVLRYLTLWKFGGIYIDLDVILKSSLESLNNFVGAEDSLDLAAGVIGFDAMDLGRRYANACLYEIITNFRGDDWGYNGPGVITRTLKKLCKTELISEMTTERCDGFKIFPPSTFYPIPWRQWRNYFNIENKISTMKAIKNSFAIHVWNKHSHSTIIKVGSEVPYAIIANKYCPRVYNNCGDIF